MYYDAISLRYYYTQFIVCLIKCERSYDITRQNE